MERRVRTERRSPYSGTGSPVSTPVSRPAPEAAKTAPSSLSSPFSMSRSICCDSDRPSRRASASSRRRVGRGTRTVIVASLRMSSIVCASHRTDKPAVVGEPERPAPRAASTRVERLQRALSPSKENGEPRGLPVAHRSGWSGREDSNLRPLGPEPSALARLSHAPVEDALRLYHAPRAHAKGSVVPTTAGVNPRRRRERAPAATSATP